MWGQRKIHFYRLAWFFLVLFFLPFPLYAFGCMKKKTKTISCFKEQSEFNHLSSHGFPKWEGVQLPGRVGPPILLWKGGWRPHSQVSDLPGYIAQLQPQQRTGHHIWCLSSICSFRGNMDNLRYSFVSNSDDSFAIDWLGSQVSCEVSTFQMFEWVSLLQTSHLVSRLQVHGVFFHKLSVHIALYTRQYKTQECSFLYMEENTICN